MKYLITFLLLFLASCGSLEYKPINSGNPADLGTFDPNYEGGGYNRVR